jgi:hypothetical protein
VGGFSDVTGLRNEGKYSKYRNGNDRENHVRKIATMNVTQDVVLRRGMISASGFSIGSMPPGKAASTTHGHDCLARRGSSVGLRVRSSASASKRWLGPVLAAKGLGRWPWRSATWLPSKLISALFRSTAAPCGLRPLEDGCLPSRPGGAPNPVDGSSAQTRSSIAFESFSSSASCSSHWCRRAPDADAAARPTANARRQTGD